MVRSLRQAALAVAMGFLHVDKYRRTGYFFGSGCMSALGCCFSAATICLYSRSGMVLGSHPLNRVIIFPSLPIKMVAGISGLPGAIKALHTAVSKRACFSRTIGNK